MTKSIKRRRKKDNVPGVNAINGSPTIQIVNNHFHFHESVGAFANIQDSDSARVHTLSLGKAAEASTKKDSVLMQFLKKVGPSVWGFIKIKAHLIKAALAHFMAYFISP